MGALNDDQPRPALAHLTRLSAFTGFWGEGQEARVSVSAYILIQTEVAKAAEVADKVSGIRGVEAAEAVTGPYDVVVRAGAGDVDELGKLVVSEIQAIPGITRTLTCQIVHL